VLTNFNVCISVEIFDHRLNTADETRGAARQSSLNSCRYHEVSTHTSLPKSYSRLPLSAAFARTAFRIIRNNSSNVTINDPNAIEPSDRVEARANADSAGFLGCQPLVSQPYPPGMTTENSPSCPYCSAHSSTTLRTALPPS
jgi:hypothetical protein